MKHKTYLLSVLVLFVFCWSVITTGIIHAQVTGEYVQTAEGEYKLSASSILTKHQSYGRFGPTTVGGSMAPSDNGNTRLDRGAFFTESGGFIGYNGYTPNSRFQPYWNESTSQFSANNPDYQKMMEAIYAKRMVNEQRNQQTLQTEPRQVQATPPVLQQRTGNARNLDYYSSGEYARKFQQPVNPSGMPTVEPIRQPNTREQVWMRGSLPPSGQVPGQQQANLSQQPVAFPPSGYNYPNSNTLPGNTTKGTSVPVQGQENNLGSRFVGNLNPMSETGSTAAPAANVVPNPVPAPRPGTQNPTVAFQEYLELLLLRSPNVNPLSPIQVIYNTSSQTATVRGVVPTQEHRIEAGRILLSDSRVKKVDNKLSILPTKVGDPLPEIFDPNLEKKE